MSETPKKIACILLLAGGMALLGKAALEAHACFEPPYRTIHRVMCHAGMTAACALIALAAGAALMLGRASPGKG